MPAFVPSLPFPPLQSSSSSTFCPRHSVSTAFNPHHIPLSQQLQRNTPTTNPLPLRTPPLSPHLSSEQSAFPTQPSEKPPARKNVSDAPKRRRGRPRSTPSADRDSVLPPSSPSTREPQATGQPASPKRRQNSRRKLTNRSMAATKDEEQGGQPPQRVRSKPNAPHSVITGNKTSGEASVYGKLRRSGEKEMTYATSMPETLLKTHGRKHAKVEMASAPQHPRKAKNLDSKKVRSKEVVHALDIEKGLLPEVSLVPADSIAKVRKGAGLAKESKRNSEKRAEPTAVPDYATDQDNRLRVEEGSISMPETTGSDGEEVSVLDGDDKANEDVMTGQFNEAQERNDEVLLDGLELDTQDFADSETDLDDALPGMDADSTGVDGEKQQNLFRQAESLVETETVYGTGRYGRCFNCEESIVIPGVAQFFCKNCGWMRRPVEIKTVAPGHHD